VKGRLLLLNLALAAAAVVVGMRARDNWVEARKRADVVLGRKVKPAPAPPFSPMPEFQSLAAADYADVAQHTLFSADRNPTVIVEVAPPKPMPPLPLLHGVMDLGDGAIAIMSVKKGGGQRGFHPGEKVGEFTLVSISDRELVLEWDGQQIPKKFDELVDRSEQTAAAPAPPAPPAAPAVSNASPAPAASVKTASPPARSGPGEQLTPTMRACVPGDNSAPGTVADGYRKVVSETPFGQRCRWELVQ
jgi:hypothetical protein